MVYDARKLIREKGGSRDRGEMEALRDKLIASADFIRDHFYSVYEKDGEKSFFEFNSA